MGGRYTVCIIGAGPGGYVAAIRAAQLGMKVALVEKRNTPGGTCLNIGCIPSKALLDMSEFYAKLVHKGTSYGVACDNIRLDLSVIMQRKEAVVRKLTRGLSQVLKTNKIDVITGTGRLAGGHEVIVTGSNGKETPVTADHIILATGSRSLELPFLPFDGTTIVDSEAALSFTQVPGELIVIGAGAVGLELGSVWSRLGSKVTVVEILPDILPGWDGQISRVLKRELINQDITFHMETRITGGEIKNKKAVLTAVKKDGKEITLKAGKVLVAAGRTPYTEGLNIPSVKIDFLKDKKHLAVDHHYRTATQHIYAVGDLIHGPMLAHKAEEEGIAVAENIAGKAGHVNYDCIPGVVYTWPEAASVGLTEAQLKEKGIPYRKGVFPFSGNGRALAMDAPQGFSKILAHRETDRIMGVHILSADASHLISEAVSVMEFGGSAEDIARTSHPHPTLSETIREAALGVDGRMIHALNM